MQHAADAKPKTQTRTKHTFTLTPHHTAASDHRTQATIPHTSTHTHTRCNPRAQRHAPPAPRQLRHRAPHHTTSLARNQRQHNARSKSRGPRRAFRQQQQKRQQQQQQSNNLDPPTTYHDHHTAQPATRAHLPHISPPQSDNHTAPVPHMPAPSPNTHASHVLATRDVTAKRKPFRHFAAASIE